MTTPANEYNPDVVSRPSESFKEAREDFGHDHFLPIGFVINRSQRYEDWAEVTIEELRAILQEIVNTLTPIDAYELCAFCEGWLKHKEGCVWQRAKTLVEAVEPAEN